MADLLFVTWDGGGNVPPALGIAQELRQRGHGVRFVGHARQHNSLAAAGFDVAPTREARPFSPLDDNSPLTYVKTFGDRGLGRDVSAALADRPADLVVVDCMLFGVMEALRKSATPYVSLEHLYDAFFRRSWLRGPMGLGMCACGDSIPQPRSRQRATPWWPACRSSTRPARSHGRTWRTWARWWPSPLTWPRTLRSW